VFERFTARITTPQERERAINRIFQCALIHRVVIFISKNRNGQAPRGVEVFDAEAYEEHVGDVLELEPERLVGFYTAGHHTRESLLDALKEDLEAAARGLEQAA
jgi:hypothetical protein